MQTTRAELSLQLMVQREDELQLELVQISKKEQGSSLVRIRKMIKNGF